MGENTVVQFIRAGGTFVSGQATLVCDEVIEDKGPPKKSRREKKLLGACTRGTDEKGTFVRPRGSRADD